MFSFVVMLVRALWNAEHWLPNHYIRLIHGIVLHATEVTSLWRDLLWLYSFTLPGLIVAAKRFKKRLD